MNIKSPLAIRYQKVTALRPNPRNARTHSKQQIRKIAKSIRTFGFINPVIVDRENQIVAGHGRVAGATSLSIDEVPTIVLDDLTEDEIRAYIIADNRLAEDAGWDKDILAIELQHLMTIEGLDFDVTLTGFEIPEVDLIIGETTQAESEREEIPVPEAGQQATSKLGDLWQLGLHRSFCGSLS